MSFSVLVDPASEEKVTETASTNPDQTSTEVQADDGLPDKFKGKTALEIAAAYQNLETELGRGRNEIGTQRRLIDELIGLRRSGEPDKSTVNTPAPITADSLYADPETTITTRAKAVADQAVASERTRIDRLENELATTKFREKHGNFEEIVQTPAFMGWLAKSPYRSGLVQKAANGNWDAADEVLNLYKETQPVAASTQTETTTTTTGAKNVGLAKSGGSNASGAVNTTGSGGKKLYSRKELAVMYTRSPEQYAALMDSGELMSAYREKRVRP